MLLLYIHSVVLFLWAVIDQLVALATSLTLLFSFNKSASKYTFVVSIKKVQPTDYAPCTNNIEIDLFKSLKWSREFHKASTV